MDDSREFVPANLKISEQQDVSALTYLWAFLIPNLLGNIIGGVSLVAAFNHAQATAD